MFTEDSNSSFLGGLKSIFGTKKNPDTNSSETLANSAEALVEEYQPTKAAPAENPIDRPMATRTVDYSHVEFKPVTKPVEEVIESDTTPSPFEEVTVEDNHELDIRFASNLIEKGGKFIYCERIADVVEELKALSEALNWEYVYCWENEIKDAFCENNFQKGVIGIMLEESNAAICLCETLVADSGNIILNPKQASRRRLPVFPKVHILIANTCQIAADLNKALDQFNIKNRGELPSVLDLNNNIKGHYYHDGNLVLKAEGTAELYVFLVDEKIQPSTRP